MILIHRLLSIIFDTHVLDTQIVFLKVDTHELDTQITFLKVDTHVLDTQIAVLKVDTRVLDYFIIIPLIHMFTYHSVFYLYFFVCWFMDKHIIDQYEEKSS